MSFKSFSFATTVALIFATIAFTSALPTKKVLTSVSEDGKPQTIQLIGDFNGTLYFYEPNVKMNWTQAKAYCKSFNLKMVSIHSKALLEDFLVDELWGRGVFYWTAAREYRDMSALYWDTTYRQPASGIFRGWQYMGREDYHLCGVLGVSMYLITDDCSKEHIPFCQN